MPQFNKEDILRLFHLLNDQMRVESLEGEVYMVGGAVMCLVFNARKATKDVDAVFAPAREMRRAVKAVAAVNSVTNDDLV